MVKDKLNHILLALKHFASNASSATVLVLLLSSEHKLAPANKVLASSKVSCSKASKFPLNNTSVAS